MIMLGNFLKLTDLILLKLIEFLLTIYLDFITNLVVTTKYF